MPADYRATIQDFLNRPKEEILGRLSRGLTNYTSSFSEIIHVWENEILFLQSSFKELLKNATEASEWIILLEYPIPRRGKRLDAVILTKNLIVALEFKSGEGTKSARLQLEDYCLDLRDFHAESASRIIVPILVAKNSESTKLPEMIRDDNVQAVLQTKRESFAEYLKIVVQFFTRYATGSIDAEKWDQSDYRPTPTIIEAAKSLYAGQNVEDICRCGAEEENLTVTTKAVLDAIKKAQDNDRKLICFITGVPGSGKTLAGLNIVHNQKLHDGELGVFLSGNGPLVKVLTESLTRDHVIRSNIKCTKQDARHKISTFVLGVHQYRDEYFFATNKIPEDRIIVFDEAQRAWNAEHLKSWRSRRNNGVRNEETAYSEPEIILNIMDRHQGWAVIIALIGGGQEINRGEAGLSEWGRAITEKYRHWQVMISPFLMTGDHSTGGQTLFNPIPQGICVEQNNSLHLKVSIRSYRAEQVSSFVHQLLELKIHQAKEIIHNHLKAYPICLTRSLETARAWLRSKQRGTRRIGLVASSGGRRLKAFGLDVKNSLQEAEDVPNWFLNQIDDVRSSNALEDVATEFAVQGLEMDWTCVCWEADFRIENKRWAFCRFAGTNWQNVNKSETKQYILNKYRVLLTRAREGMIIWIPQGNLLDATRKPESYDQTAEYLIECGIPCIDD